QLQKPGAIRSTPAPRSAPLSLSVRDLGTSVCQPCPSLTTPVIPRGSTVLITGVNGFIASNIADQFLRAGYRMKRRRAKIYVIRKGVSAVLHKVANSSMNPSRHEVIPGTVTSTTNAFKAAASEPRVKRFVLTSSSAAALVPKSNTPCTVTMDTWKDESVAIAYRDPPYELERGFPVYAASKTLSEKKAWKSVRERKPGFVLNTVLPNMTFGASLDSVNQGHPSTSGMLAELFCGNLGLSTLTTSPSYHISSHLNLILNHIIV
ncbi:hypothetical protein PG994_008904, partial [Apiospora phragmitis]